MAMTQPRSPAKSEIASLSIPSSAVENMKKDSPTEISNLVGHERLLALSTERDSEEMTKWKKKLEKVNLHYPIMKIRKPDDFIPNSAKVFKFSQAPQATGLKKWVEEFISNLMANCNKPEYIEALFRMAVEAKSWRELNKVFKPWNDPILTVMNHRVDLAFKEVIKGNL